MNVTIVYNETLRDYVIDAARQPYDNEHLHQNVWGFYYGFYFKIYHPLALVFCFTGLVTNIINVAVFSHPEMRNSTNFLLTTIALADILIVLERCCRSIAYYVTSSINDFVNVYTAMYFYGMYTVEFAGLMMSEWLSVSLAIWRFLAVTYPLKAKQWCSTKRAKVATTLVVIFSLVTSLPCLYMVSTREDVFRGLPIYLLTPRSFNGVRFGIQHDSYLGVLCLMVTLPILILIFLTAGLIRNTIKARKCRLKLGIQLPLQEANKSQTTIMLIVVLATFIIVNTPSTVLTVACLISYYPTKFAITSYNNFLQSVLVFSNTTTFITYLCMSSKYRQTFRTFLSQMKLKERKRYGSHETTVSMDPECLQ